MDEWTWERARVSRVVDGDTFVAVLRRDLGFHGVIEFEQRLRVLGVNAPPAHTEEGLHATEFVREFTKGDVTVVTSKPYKYGDEWMADVIAASGQRLSAALVLNELAVPWSGKGPRPGG